MNPFDTAESFNEFCARTERTSELRRVFQRNLENLGFRYFACASHVDPLNAREAVMVLNYPPDWVACYSERKLHLIDPVFRRADRTRLAFHWDDPSFRAGMTRDQRKMQRLAQDFGVAHGFTVPIHGPVSSSSCSVIPDSPRIHRHCYMAVELMAQRLYDRIACLQRLEDLSSEGPAFTRRERECLTLAGQGKSDEDMGAILRITRHTAHSHMESAKKRVELHSRTAAVVYAIGSRQVRMEDVFPPLHRAVRRHRSP